MTAFLLLPRPVAASGRDQFCVINFQLLESLIASGTAEEKEELNVFRKNNSDVIGGIRYLVIPAAYIDRSRPTPTSPKYRAIVEASLPREAQYLRGVNIYPELLHVIRRAKNVHPIDGVLAGDVEILNEADIRNLARLVWFNRSSPPSSDEAETIRSFDRDFLDNLSRRWFLNPQNGGVGAENLLFVTGLKPPSPKASVLLYIPDHDGPTPLFNMFSGERQLFEKMLSILRSKDVPISLSFNFENGLFPSGSANFDELFDDLQAEIYATADRTDLIGRLQSKTKTGEWKLSMSNSLPLRVLNAHSVELSFRNSNFRFIKDKQVFLRIRIPFPAPQLILAGNNSKEFQEFALTVTNPLSAAGLNNPTPGRYVLSRGDLDLPVSPLEVRSRYRKTSNPERPDFDLFTNPEAVLSQVLGERRRPRLALSALEQRSFTSGVLAAKDDLDALWDHLSVESMLHKKELRVLLIRPEPRSPISDRHKVQLHRQANLVRCFLEAKMKEKGTHYILLEAEQTVHASDTTADIDGIEVIVIPD